ncbi:hypothetical protein ACYF6T_05040 [Streptomyces sp. 7R007]
MHTGSKRNHEHGLRVEFFRVSHFSIDRDQSIDWMEAATVVVLDEIIPAADDHSREIKLRDSSIRSGC